MFLQTFSGKIWEKFNSGKVASLAYAEIQGKSALASYMQTPSSMKEEKQLFPEVSYHDEGQDANDHVCLSDTKLLFLFCFWYMDSKCICSVLDLSTDFTLYICIIQEQLFSSIWNITAPDSDWSYTMDLLESTRENGNSKNPAEESS